MRFHSGFFWPEYCNIESWISSARARAGRRNKQREVAAGWRANNRNDPLRYAANLTALAAAVYLGVTALLRLAVGQLLRLFNKSATLEKPHCCA